MSHPARHRLFVALEVREPARAALVRAVEAVWDDHMGMRWTDPDDWHVTLAFVGATDEEGARRVAAAAAAVAEQTASLRVRLDGGVGTFDGAAIWAGVEYEPELAATAAALRERLCDSGFAIEKRRFTPHCTIARVPRGAVMPPGFLDEVKAPAVTWTARRLAVVRSRLSIGGAQHTINSAHELTGDPGV